MNKDAAIAFVAEHIIGFERGDCHGRYGGASVGESGSGTWQWCDWCGREIRDGVSGPCPKFPFPSFSLRDLMLSLGEMGHHTMVRFDPLRNQHRFTVCLDDIRVCDTDEPFEALCQHLASQDS